MRKFILFVVIIFIVVIIYKYANLNDIMKKYSLRRTMILYRNLLNNKQYDKLFTCFFNDASFNYNNNILPYREALLYHKKNTLKNNFMQITKFKICKFNENEAEVIYIGWYNKQDSTFEISGHIKLKIVKKLKWKIKEISSDLEGFNMLFFD